jgi:hypothetical protein
LAFEILVGTYTRARPDLHAAVIIGVVTSAVERARMKHTDWDRFAPGIEFLSAFFFTDHQKLPLDDYLETLYCAVKHGDFSRRWRVMLRAQAPAAAATSENPI